MTANVPFNPLGTTVAGGAFVTDSYGLVQGQVYPEPAKVYQKASGYLSSSETLPMWAGVGIYVDIPLGGVTNPRSALGGAVGRATSVALINGFSVWSYAQIITPQSPVPLAPSYGQVEFYKLGSGQRIAVKATPGIAALKGSPINSKVSWDYNNQQLVPYSNTTVSSGTYTSGTGAVSLTTAAAHGLEPGDTFELSAVTGTDSYAELDGEQTATAGTTGETLNFTGPTGLTLTITGGTVSNAALNVLVLDILTTNCMVVDWDGTNATWNYDGMAAIIQI